MLQFIQVNQPTMLNITADRNGTISWGDALRLVNDKAAGQRSPLRMFFLLDYSMMREERIDLGELNVWIIENS